MTSIQPYSSLLPFTREKLVTDVRAFANHNYASGNACNDLPTKDLGWTPSKMPPDQVLQRQIPILHSTLNIEQRETIGKFQESIARYRNINCAGQVSQMGSAIVISPNGLILTANHCAGLSTAINSFSNALQFLAELESDSKGSTNSHSKFPRHKIMIDIPYLSDESESGVATKSYEVVLLFHDDDSDLSLYIVDDDSFQDEQLQFARLESGNVSLDEEVFKIGHSGAFDANYYASGRVINPRWTTRHHFSMRHMMLGFIPREIDHIVTDVPSIMGDSGSASFNNDFNVVSLNTSAFYNPVSSRKHAHPAIEDRSNINEISIGLTVQDSILPALDRFLGDEQFKRLLDGQDVVITKNYLQRELGKRTTTVLVP